MEGQEILKFSCGNCHGRQCIIEVDGAWKKLRKKRLSLAGIGWVARSNAQIVFRGNEAVRANSALQSEGLAVLKALKEAQNRGEQDIRVSTDSANLVHALNKQVYPCQISSIFNDIIDMSRTFNSWEICKVDRSLTKDSHKLATSARMGILA